MTVLAGLRAWWRCVTAPKPRREGAYIVKSIDGYSVPRADTSAGPGGDRGSPCDAGLSNPEQSDRRPR